MSGNNAGGGNATGGAAAIGGAATSGGNAAVGGAVAAQQHSFRGSSKAPLFEETFELYQAEEELYLADREAWDVVTGTELRHATDQGEQATFDRRDRLARAAILRGLRGCKNDDASKVCGMATAREMWQTLVSDHTQRDFSYAMLLKQQLYQCTHEPGQSMAEYIRTMTKLRQQLRNMGTEHVITDGDMACLLLMGVAMTHRELLEQFDLPTRQGNPPTLQQVTNALRSRDECDRMVEQGGGNAGAVMSITVGNNFRGGGDNGWQNGSDNWQGNGGGGNRPNGDGGNGQYSTGGGGKKSMKKCYHCKKACHLRRDCWHYKNKSLKVSSKGPGGDKKSQWQQKKRSEVKKEVAGMIDHMQWLNNGGDDSSSEEDDQMVGMVKKTALMSDPSAWMLDSGSTTHVCIDRSRFLTEKKSRASFRVWTGDVTRGVMSGSVQVRTLNGSSGDVVELPLENVEYSPHGSTNLLSLSVMEKTGWSLSTCSPQEQERKMFLDRGGIRLFFAKKGAHYWQKTVDDDVPTVGISMLTVNADASPLMRWHERLGHLNVAAIKHIMENSTVTGMEIPKELFKKKFVCLSCMSAKQKRRSYKKSAAEKRTKVNYERLMSDTCDMGKYLPGLSGFKYFQLIQDEGSRYKWCFPLKVKSDANANTIRLMTELLAQGHRGKTFSSDGGGEFVNRELKMFCEARGIRFVHTHPYTPEENALVEKLNGVLVGKMRAAMHAADLPNPLWPEVLQYIVDIDNMSATRALNGKTPSEKLLGKAPDVSKIRVCGSVGFIHEPKRKTKLSPRAEPGLLLGFAQRSPGYRFLHLRTGKLVEARDVRFREDITVSRLYTSSLLKGHQASYKQIPFVPLPVEYVATESSRTEAARTVTHNLPEDAETAAANSTSFGGGVSSSSSSSGESETEDEEMQEAGEDTPPGGAHPVSAQAGGTNAQPAAQPQQRGGQRTARHQTRRQRQAATGVQANTGPVRRSGRRRRQNVRLGDYVFSMEVEIIGTPTSVEEAMRSAQSEQWKDAMKAEWESLLKDGTWKLVDRPKSSRGKRVKVLTTKWVYSIKRDEKGNILRFKARLVIHGFKQRFGFEYWDTYSPVVRIITMLLVLLIALLLVLDAGHVDVETAFLNSPLRGVVIYMEQPAYFDDGTGRVCWLLKGLYGLKQAARIWYQTLHAYLVELGFKRCAHDVGLYAKYIDGRIVLVTVYVDGMVIVGKTSDIDAVIEALRLKFTRKDLGRVRHLLSMEILYEPGVMLCLSQSEYTKQLLAQFQMGMARSVGSPQMHNEKMLPLERDRTKVNDPSIPYREIVGKLQYLVTCTRPDIANAVRCLGRHAGAYTKENFASAKRVLQYLQGTKTFGLVYRRSEAKPAQQLQLRAFSDADHANCPDTGRSVTGYVLQLNGFSFGFKSKKQKSVTDDTCKSELVAASKCVEDLLWAHELITEIGLKPLDPELHCDNQSTIKVCEHVGNYDGVKRLAKMSHKIAELVEAKAMSLNYVPTADNMADMFTKALGPQRFEQLRELLGVKDVADTVEHAALTTRHDRAGDQDV